MIRHLTALVLGAALCVPVAQLRADDKHHDREKARRYYDQQKRDYHEWNEREDRAYRRWREERRERYQDFARANKRQQREYWQWRHSHSDTMLWPDRR